MFTLLFKTMFLFIPITILMDVFTVLSMCFRHVFNYVCIYVYIFIAYVPMCAFFD